MPFCSECGSKLELNAKFCNVCGKKVGEPSTSNTINNVSDGNIKMVNCPRCGSPIDSFVAVCSYCGCEIRNATANSAVKEFEKKLEQIEATKKPSSMIGEAALAMLGVAGGTNITDQKIANLIANYPVPNNKEDIMEFLIMAVSNIDEEAYDKTFNGYGVNSTGKQAITAAWKSKYNQMYHKARLMFPEEKRLDEINKMYEAKQKKINKVKFMPFIIMGALFAGLMIMTMIMFALM